MSADLMGGDNGTINTGADNTTTHSEPSSTDTDTSAEGVVVKYPEGLPEEYYGNPSLDKFVNKETGDFNTGAALQSLIHAQKVIGQDKIAIPSKDAGAEEWQNTFRKLGLPEKEEDYKIDVEGIEDGDQEILKGFISTAHKNGILPHQAKEVLNYFKEATENQSKAFEEESTAQYNTRVDALKKEWGDSFQTNANIATEAIKSLADEGLINSFKEKGYFADPDFTKFAYSLGKSLMDDDSLAELKGPGFKDAGELQQNYAESYGIVAQGNKHPQYEYHRKRLAQVVDEAGKRGVSLI